MFNHKHVRGIWWACAAAVAVLAAGCVSAASEESGGGALPVDGGGVGSGSVTSSSSIADSISPPAGGVTTNVVEEVTTTAVRVGEENGGGGASSGGEPPGGVVSVEVRVSEEGLERLRRVLGEDKFAVVLEAAELWSEPGALGVDSGVLLGRLAGESGFLTEERLGRLAERRNGGRLVAAARSYSEEELADYVSEGEEWLVGPRDTWYADVSDVDGRFVDEYSDDDLKGMAFSERAQAERDSRLWEVNDLSTPVGAFCWAVLRVRQTVDWTGIGLTGGFHPWRSRNLRVWHLEREAEERGIELEWETPSLDADLVLRRVLLEATAPEVRSVVFASGLPSVLRSAAERVYSVYDELLALPVRRVRPTVEELAGYGRLRDLTEEEIAQIWPEELELDYRDEDDAKYWNAMRMLRADEVREFLNAECKERPVENPCPPWEVPETDVWLSIICSDQVEDMFEIVPIESCPLFYKADIREVGVDRSSECTVNEEAAERFNELMDELIERERELMEREEMGRQR